ncbi:MAG: hypothetical protein ABSE93_14300 [Terriglobia bacterium]|jgi:tetratricopeptide (TPR) repeat protein
MRSSHIFETYYYGGKKWDNYLIDIQESIDAVSTQAMEIGEAQLAGMHAQTAQLGKIGDTLQSGFDEMRAQFQWGFTLLAERMDQQIKIVARVASQLDEIHKTLQSPLMTQARELFQLGQERLSKGLLDKALEVFLHSEQKNEVDFLLQLQIGKLLLYGKDRDNDVIDIPQAERHLLLAARFAKAEKDSIPKWNEYCAQAYFHAGVAAYLRGEKEYLAGRNDAMRACLERALGFLINADNLWPKFLESAYTLAKCHSLLGQLDEGRKKLEYFSDLDRRYLAKAGKDKDFSPLWPDIESIIRQSAVSPGPRAQATLAHIAKTAEAIGWARRIGPNSHWELRKLASIEKDIGEAKQSLQGVNVDIEDLCAHVVDVRHEVEQTVESDLQNRIRDIEGQITPIKSRLQGCELQIRVLRGKMAEKSDTKTAWQVGFLFGFLFVIASCFLLGVVGTLVLGEATFRQYGGGIGIPVSVVAAVTGGYVGNAIFRGRRNRPYVSQIDEAVRVSEECARTLAPLKNNRDETKRELEQFLAWRSLSAESS